MLYLPSLNKSSTLYIRIKCYGVADALMFAMRFKLLANFVNVQHTANFDFNVWI